MLDALSARMSFSAIMTLVWVVEGCGKNFCLRLVLNWKVLNDNGIFRRLPAHAISRRHFVTHDDTVIHKRQRIASYDVQHVC
jgi:hypothetical protein